MVSTLDTHQTFLEYVGEENLDSEFVEMIRIWQWEKWSLAVQHLALAEVPHFKAADAQPDLDEAFIYVLGYESLADLKGHWDAMSRGELPATAGFNCCFPSRHDPFQAPPGAPPG